MAACCLVCGEEEGEHREYNEGGSLSWTTTLRYKDCCSAACANTLAIVRVIAGLSVAVSNLMVAIAPEEYALPRDVDSLLDGTVSAALGGVELYDERPNYGSL